MYRLIGIGLHDLLDAAEAASDLFSDGEHRALEGERALDSLRARFGAEAVVSGRSLKR
jgi:DNA polymerase-4